MKNQENPCWLWYGWLKGNGYASKSSKGKHVYVHRLMYETLIGPIPNGLVIDHLCRNRSCVNPSHMEPVTHRENVLRGDSEAAKRAKQTHCKRGHAFNDENTYRIKNGNGRRVCKTCHSAFEIKRSWSRKGVAMTLGEALVRAGTGNKNKKFCKRGHPLSGNNLFKNNQRRCRICAYGDTNMRAAQKRGEDITIEQGIRRISPDIMSKCMG